MNEQIREEVTIVLPPTSSSNAWNGLTRSHRAGMQLPGGWCVVSVAHAVSSRYGMISTFICAREVGDETGRAQ